MLRALAALACAAAATESPEARIDAWLRGGPPLDTWRVTSGREVVRFAFGPPAVHGMAKTVARGAVDGQAVVVKAPLADGDGDGRAAARARSHARDELVFLEMSRGRPGVPFLYGAWLEDGRPTYAVADAGAPLNRPRTRGSDALNLDVGYASLAREDPLGLARAILACFESFSAEFFLSDFRPDQFVFRATPLAFALVDGPVFLDRKRHGLADRRRRYSTASDARPCASDADCPKTPRFHACAGCRSRHCAPPCDGNTTAAPEAGGLCRRRRCAPITPSTHVFDAAARAYLLPLCAASAPPGPARRALEALIAAMTAPEPADRPTFADARIRLGAVGADATAEAAPPAAPAPLGPSATEAAYARLRAYPDARVLATPRRCEDGAACPARSTSSWIVVLPKFLNATETAAVADAGRRQGFARATTGFGRARGPKRTAARTGAVAWCRPDSDCAADRTVGGVLDRVADALAVPRRFFEPMQLLRYEAGEAYAEHHDTAGPAGVSRRGHRLMTAYLYLNDLAPGGGGETNFTRRRVAVAPASGSLLVWPNAWAGDGETPTLPDDAMYHEAAKVSRRCVPHGRLACTKYGANIWIRERPRDSHRIKPRP